MNTPSPQPADEAPLSLEQVVRQFTSAEEALRSMLESAEQLRSASDQVEAAFKTVSETKQFVHDQAKKSQAEMDTRLHAAERASAEQIERAKAQLLEARSDLERAERSIGDASSAVYGLTAEFKEIARTLKDTAIAFRALDPERLWKSEKVLIHQYRILVFMMGLTLVALMIGAGVLAFKI